MTANAQIGRLMGHGDRVRKGGGIGHERGRGDDALRMALQDGAVDARGEAEVVGIDDEPEHATG